MKKPDNLIKQASEWLFYDSYDDAELGQELPDAGKTGERVMRGCRYALYAWIAIVSIMVMCTL